MLAVRSIRNLRLVLTVTFVCLLPAKVTQATEPESNPEPAAVATTNGKTDEAEPVSPMLFTARFTAEDLIPLLNKHTDLLPFPLQSQEKRDAAIAALKRVNMGVLIEELTPFLSAELPVNSIHSTINFGFPFPRKSRSNSGNPPAISPVLLEK